MQRTEKTNTPLGLALFFLSLAIVPISLRAAGFDVGLSPSLSAAVEAWRGVATVLSNDSPTGGETELSLVKKYSFAEQAPSPEVAASDSSDDAEESDYSLDLRVGELAEAQPTESLPRCSTTAVPKETVAIRAARPRARALRAAIARQKARIASRARIVLIPPVDMNAWITSLEDKAFKRRIDEAWILRTRALREALTTIQYRRDPQVSVRIKPIALFSGSSPCGGEELLPIERADKLRTPRISRPAAEEPQDTE